MRFRYCIDTFKKVNAPKHYSFGANQVPKKALTDCLELFYGCNLSVLQHYWL